MSGVSASSLNNYTNIYLKPTQETKLPKQIPPTVVYRKQESASINSGTNTMVYNKKGASVPLEHSLFEKPATSKPKEAAHVEHSLYDKPSVSKDKEAAPSIEISNAVKNSPSNPINTTQIMNSSPVGMYNSIQSMAQSSLMTKIDTYA